jgi:hypothetical protein
MEVKNNLEPQGNFRNFDTMENMRQFRNSCYWVKENGDVYKLHKAKKYGVIKGIDYGVDRWTKAKPTLRNHGYHSFTWWHKSVIPENKKFLNVSQHQVVAEAWIPNPNNLPQVNHIDGNKSNNHPSNLEWCTQAQNARHAAENKLYRQSFSEQQIRDIRNADGNYADIARIYSADTAQIRNIRLNKSYKWVSSTD